MYSYSEQQIASLERARSPVRLQRYITLAGGDRVLALRLHIWNANLGDSLHLPLQVFELLFRNALNDQLARRFGDDWYDRRFNLSETRTLSTIQAAKDSLTNQGRAVTPSAVIAQFTFGFWVTLLTRRYETRFWVPVIWRAFPYANSLQRQVAHDAVDAIRHLRNRIAHHEPNDPAHSASRKKHSVSSISHLRGL
jgi:hypothetical protein